MGFRRCGIRLFPDTDAQYKGISSIVLLKNVMERVTQAGYRIGNVDVIVIAQKPKLGGYFPQMKEVLAEAMGCEPGRINLKATTEEHLGFTGREEGMAAAAVCLLEAKQ